MAWPKCDPEKYNLPARIEEERVTGCPIPHPRLVIFTTTVGGKPLAHHFRSSSKGLLRTNDMRPCRPRCNR
jgi:hypothetical protein